MQIAVRRAQVLNSLRILFVLAVLAGGLGFFLGTDDLEVVRAGVILSMLVIVSLLLFWRVASSDPQGARLLIIILLSFGLKLVMVSFRYYGGLLADAYVYDAVGQGIATQLSRGEWPEDVLTYGTRFVRLLAGLAYYAAGITFGGISILWAWFGLLGMLFFHLAFSTAFPGGNRRLYTLLIFLYPSLLLWTSSLGKDALVIMFLGMAAYGVARLQRGVVFSSLWWFVLGMSGALMIRPHIASVFLISFGASALIFPIRVGLMTPIVKLAGVGVLAALSLLVVVSASGYAGLEELGTGGVIETIGGRQEQSARGGSAFEQVDVTTPAGLLMAAPTILFRPFPWEANNLFALIASLEGLGLLALIVVRRRSVLTALSVVFRNSYVLFVTMYILLFIFFFTAIGNFGIIARQRASQLFPFVFMLIAYLPVRRSDRVETEEQRPT